MNAYNLKPLVGTLLFVILIAHIAFAENDAVPKRDTLPTYQLPTDGVDAKGFCMFGSKLCFFQHSTRTLFMSGPGGKLVPMEDVAGWAVSDVAIVGQSPIYCSRDRTFRKVSGKVTTQTIPGTTNLISIATDGRNVYLLDVGGQATILAVDVRSGKLLGRFPYDGYRPVDIAVNANGIYVLDTGDRCIHQLDPRTGKTKLKFQIGPGIGSGSGGIMWIGPSLYVHEADFNRLRPINWQVDGAKVVSWKMPLKMKFVQESSNESDLDSTRVNFEIPVPASGPLQEVGKVIWSQPPNEIATDRFDQRIAKFRDIEIAPKADHELSYTTNVTVQAVQYDPPRLAIAKLDNIPQDIKTLYLAADPIYRMDSAKMVAAAKASRCDENGKEPSDVRSLIENIAWNQSKVLNYVMDDTWDDAETTLNRATGSCSEYSFLFSCLCRLNKVPTRLVGGIQINDALASHESNAFHRWTEIYYPNHGWIPVDITKYDDANEGSRDRESLFGTPGYLVQLSTGGVDENGLGIAYYINRHYRGGKRERKTYVSFEPSDAPSLQILNF